MSRNGFRAQTLASLVAALAVMIPSKTLHAQTAEADSVSLSPVGCSGLDTAEVERVLGLELAAAAAKASQVPARKPVVHILCTNATLHIEITDPESGAKRALDVPAPREGEGRERTVALAASQLFLGSWLEMIERAEAEKAAEAPKPKAQLAPKLPEPKPPEPAPLADAHRVRYELGVGAEGTLRHLNDPMFLYGVGLSFTRIQAASWFVGLSAHGELGNTDRNQGEVRARLLSAELDTGLRSQFTHWALDVQLQLGVLAVQGKGISDAPAVEGSTVNGAALDVGLAAGPSFGSGVLRLKLLAAAGYVFSQVRLRVAQEPSVELGGPWAAISLWGTFGWEP